MARGGDKVSAATLPPLTLTKDDESELRALCDDLEREVLTAYEEYLYVHDRQVDPRRWKPLRAKDGMHVYRERRAVKHGSSGGSRTGGGSMLSHHSSSVSDVFGHRSSSSSASSSSRPEFTSTLEIGPMHAMAATSNMPIVMVAGTAPGTLDDALLGISVSDTPSIRRKSEYQRDKLEDCAVLAPLSAPRFEDPFYFRGVLWFLKDYPIINTIVKPRDLLQMASVRQMRTSRGERVGVIVYHSIAHRDLPEFTDAGIIRVQNSLSVVFRQVDEQRVEVFMKNFVDPLGKVPEMFITQDVAQALITSAELSNVGLKIKLHHLMRGRQRQRSLSSDSQLTNAAAAAAAARGPTQCVSCEKPLGRLFSSSGAVCQLCYKLACSKCLVTKKIVVESTATSIAMRPFEFCVGCIMNARSVPAAAVARAEHNLRPPSVSESFLSNGDILAASRLVERR